MAVNQHIVMRYTGFFHIVLLSALLSAAQFAKGIIISGPVVNPSNGHSYFLLSSNTWTASEAEAITLGGHLATVRNASENTWICTTFSQVYYLWIGLNDTAIKGTFAWANGEPVTYINWYPGEPNNTQGLEDYVEIYNFSGGNFQWNDNSSVSSAGDFGIYGVVEVNNGNPSDIIVGESSGGVLKISAPNLSGANPAYVQLQILPPAAVQAGASWRLSSETSFPTYSRNLVRIITGTNVSILLQPVWGWELPTNKVVTSLAAGALNIVSNIYYTPFKPMLRLDPTQGFRITGTSNISYRMEYCTNLATVGWLPFLTNFQSNDISWIPTWPHPKVGNAYFRAVWVLP